MSVITFAYPDFESLGVGYLVSVCRAAGFPAHVVRYEAEDPYTNRRRTFDPREVAERIAATGPDVAAFSCVTHNYRHQLACARALKALRPDVFVLFGGVHPTAVPARVLENPEVDAVAIGEAEVSLVRFLEAASGPTGFRPPTRAIPGFVRRAGGGVEDEASEGPLPALDTLPFPEKRAFHPDGDVLASEYFITTSRGCPYRCSYCFNSCLSRLRGGTVFRRRSVRNVIEELEEARRSFGIRAVHFLDDSFTVDPRWVREFAAEYRRRVGLPFVCSANPDLIDASVVRLLRDAGCVDVQIGVQSLDERISREVLERRCDGAAIARAVALLKDAGILVQADMILGVPGDTLAAHEEALRFMNRVRPHVVSVFWLAYYPGTALLARAVQEGWLSPEERDRVERGEPLAEGGLHAGWDRRELVPFRAVAFLYNYLPLLPRFVVEALLRTRAYRLLRVRSYLLSTAVPRALRSALDRRYFTGRGHLRRFLRRLVGDAPSPSDAPP